MPFILQFKKTIIMQTMGTLTKVFMFQCSDRLSPTSLMGSKTFAMWLYSLCPKTRHLTHIRTVRGCPCFIFLFFFFKSNLLGSSQFLLFTLGMSCKVTGNNKQIVKSQFLREIRSQVATKQSSPGHIYITSSIYNLVFYLFLFKDTIFNIYY